MPVSTASAPGARETTSLAAALTELRGAELGATALLDQGAAAERGWRFDALIAQARAMESRLAAAVRALAELHDEQCEEAMLAEGVEAARRAEREVLETAVAQARASGRLVVLADWRAPRRMAEWQGGRHIA